MYDLVRRQNLVKNARRSFNSTTNDLNAALDLLEEEQIKTHEAHEKLIRKAFFLGFFVAYCSFFIAILSTLILNRFLT